MDPHHAKKTAFQNPIDNFHYTAMPFDPRNAGPTYSRAMTVIFHDMLYEYLEDYDVIIVTSWEVNQHMKDLKKCF